MRLHTAKINQAIYDCLERCYAAPLPLACLAEFVLDLKNDPGWKAEEIDAVETYARQVLKLIVYTPPAGRLAT